MSSVQSNRYLTSKSILGDAFPKSGEVSTSMHPSETSCNVAVGEVTDINLIPHVESSSVIYDLQGRPAKANQRGIYIVNGKLVIK